MKQYLVTGAAGFIGSEVSKELLRQGNAVYTIDNLSTGHESAIPNGVHFIKGNCQDTAIVAQLAGIEFEAIFHIAGQSSGEISFDDPVYDLQTNTQSTLLLLKLALQCKCRKFIFASTMSVYGDQDVLPVTEDYVPNPKSFYGVGKLASEHYLRIYSEYGIACTALRLFNVYGPGQNMENLRQGMVSIFIAQALQSNSIHVKGSKDRFRDFVYISDVVNAFIKSEKIEEKGYRVFNVCNGVKITVGELVEQIVKNLHTNTDVKFEGSTPGDQFGIFANADKIKNTLQWRPEVGFEEGIAAMIRWAKKV